MRTAIVGGDRRSEQLARLMKADGHSVSTYALERGDGPGAVGCIQGCTYGALAVILPVPSVREGAINTPLSDAQLSVEELLSALWPGQLVFGTGGELGERVTETGAKWYDISEFTGFSDFNSALTAEGAVGILINSSPRSIMGSPILITGSGSLSSALSIRLRALGGQVTVCARRGGDIDFSQLRDRIGRFCFIINTVPQRVIGEDIIAGIGADALCLELASPPYGIDPRAMERLGKKLIRAPGLPGKTAPLTAAEYLREHIYGVTEAQNGR